MGVERACGPSQVQGSALAVGDPRPQTEKRPTRLSRNLRFRRNSSPSPKGTENLI